MGKHSSTSSSSEPALPSGFPWAFVLALVAVACVEIVFRSAELRTLIPYSTGRLEYEATAQLLEAYGPAEVSIVGSSRTREGIAVPVLSDRLSSALGRPVAAANYACPGARAVENLALTEHLLRNGRPDILLYGITCIQFCGDRTRWRDIAQFKNTSGWWETFRGDPSSAMPLLPNILRRSVGKHWLTLRYRKRAATLAGDAIRSLVFHDTVELSLASVIGGATSPAPQRGETTRWHRFGGDRSLRTHPISSKRVLRYLAPRVIGGAYRFEKAQEENAGAILHAARDAGVYVVVFEVPVPPVLKEHLPIGTVTEARAIASGIATEQGVSFFSVEDYGLAWTELDFREQSHMNLRGATRLTEWLADHVILPHLRDAGRSKRTAQRPSPQ